MSASETVVITNAPFQAASWIAKLPTDFERAVALRARTEAIARHLTEFLKKIDRFAKIIFFCVDQEHADEMRRRS